MNNPIDKANGAGLNNAGVLAWGALLWGTLNVRERKVRRKAMDQVWYPDSPSSVRAGTACSPQGDGGKAVPVP